MGLLCLILAACAPRSVADGGVYRVATAPIYSNAVFDTRRLEGTWAQVAAFSSDEKKRCRPGDATFGSASGAAAVSYRLCLSGQEITGAGPIAATGPGRFGVGSSDATGEVWWVLWVDEGYRTMAIGTPSGAFGFILNRGGTLPVDRLNAAREVFDFNGYDLEKLDVFGP